LLTGEQHHVSADGTAEIALLQETVSKLVKVSDFSVILVSELIDGQEALFGMEGEVVGVVISEVKGAVAITYDKELQEAEQRLGVAVARIIFVFDDLFHGSTGIHAERLQLDLRHWHAIDEQDYVVAVMTVIRVDTELINDLEMVFAPVLEVHQ
jgi:hypothetical protein